MFLLFVRTQVRNVVALFHSCAHTRLVKVITDISWNQTDIGGDSRSNKTIATPSLVHGTWRIFHPMCLDGALIPIVGEAKTNDDEQNVQHHHKDAHAFGHLPFENKNSEENKHEHKEEERNGTSDSLAAH